MHQPQTFVSKPVVVQAIQWTGDNLRAVQDFVAPFSPMLSPHVDRALQVSVFDERSTLAYPSLGRQFKAASVPVGAWVIKHANGDLDVVSATDFEARYVDANDVIITTTDADPAFASAEAIGIPGDPGEVQR